MAFNSIRDQNLNFCLGQAFRKVSEYICNSCWLQWYCSQHCTVQISICLNALIAKAWVLTQSWGILMCFTRSKKKQIINICFRTALKLTDLIFNFNEYLFYWHLNSQVDWVSSRVTPSQKGNMWDWQNVFGCVRPHACGLLWLGFVVPALNCRVPCTWSARKNVQALPWSWEAWRAK